jgi:FkbM family methyltransferase
MDSVEALLAEDREAVLRRARTAFDEAAHPLGNSLVLFGAGNLGRKTLKGLRKVGIEPKAFSDNAPHLWGTSVEGVPVLSPKDAAGSFGQSATFLMTIWRGEGSDRMPDRIAQVQALGCKRVVPFSLLFWKHPDVFLPHYLFDVPNRVRENADGIRAVAQLWEDGGSRAEFLAQLRFRACSDFALPEPVNHEIYFPQDLFDLTSRDVFVDCGAFDGDTIRRYLLRQPTPSGRIEAFEPDPKNLSRLRGYVAGLPDQVRSQIAIHPYAVSARRERVRFEATGTEAAAVGRGTDEVEAAPLDEVLATVSPTYIKMDVEGSEVDALNGARRLLQKHVPALAICVYHRVDHLWAVPKLIHEVSDQYRLFLRPHLLEGWDTVCYAVPRGRLKS